MDLYEIEAISKGRNKERKEEGLTFSPKACSPFCWLLPSGRCVSFQARYVCEVLSSPLVQWDFFGDQWIDSPEK